MAKGKKKQQSAPWLVFLKGPLLALGIYLMGQLLAALLVVRGALSEESMFPMVGAFCAIASFCGGLLCAHRPAWGTLPSAMLCAVIFALVLAMVGLLVWDGLTLTGRGGILLLCALGGGTAAGILSGSVGGSRRRGKGRL